MFGAATVSTTLVFFFNFFFLFFFFGSISPAFPPTLQNLNTSPSGGTTCLLESSSSLEINGLVAHLPKTIKSSVGLQV
jgi:hypothetical protein